MRRFFGWLFQMNAYRIGVIIGLLFTVAELVNPWRVDELPVIGSLENILYDLRFHERGQITPPGDVVVAPVDERAIAVLGRWPFPRGVMATLVDKMTALGAKAIVFDMVLHDRVHENAVIGKLRQAYADVALTNAEATRSLNALKAAVPSGPAAASLDVLEKFRTLQEGYAKQLDTASEGAEGDLLLADAVRHSGRAVLGGIALTPDDLKNVPAAEERATMKALDYFRLPFPTLDPVNFEGDTLTYEGQPIYGVDWRTWPGALIPYPELLRGPSKHVPYNALAFFNTSPDADGVIRREPLVLALGDASQPEQLLLVPEIDLAGVLKYTASDSVTTRLWATTDTSKGLEYIVYLPGSENGVKGPLRKSAFKRIPVDQQGQLLLNYYGTLKNFPTVSLGDIARGTVPQHALDGKIVLVGATALGTFDQRVTPFEQMVPGVVIHATAMDNILHDQYLQRPWWAGWAESLILLIIALGVGRLLASVPVVWGIPVMLGTALGYHAFDYALFRYYYLSIFSAVPMLEVTSIFVGQTIYRYVTEERAKQQIRRTFEHYLNPSVIEEMVSDPSKLKLGGEKRTLTVLFSDIRGFTTISEKLSPEELAKLINEYLTPMTNLVFQSGGTLDKYIGDALMAIWGAPMQQSDHALRCCRTAVAMMAELKRLQERWKAEGHNYPPIDVGIGINSGPMVVGNMGGAQRFDYTVLGDNVNLASRLEGTNKEYRSHIIISQNTWELVQGQVAAVELGAVRVKGKKEPVRIYELLDDKPPTEKLAALIALFSEAVALFRQQQWAACRQKCEEVLAKWPGYGPPAAYLEFCREYEANPPGEDWDGVYTMTHK